MNKVTIGIDPGQKGGFAILAADGACRVRAMPFVGKELDLDAIADWIWRAGWLGIGADGENWHAWIEDAQAMRRPLRDAVECPTCGCLPATQGVVSTGTFMRGAGLVEGCLRGMGIECMRIKAQVWQKIMLGPKRPRGRAAIKAASIAKARELFPDVNFTRPARCTTYSDGMADSALIAMCGSRMNVV